MKDPNQVSQGTDPDQGTVSPAPSGISHAAYNILDTKTAQSELLNSFMIQNEENEKATKKKYGHNGKSQKSDKKKAPETKIKQAMPIGQMIPAAGDNSRVRFSSMKKEDERTSFLKNLRKQTRQRLQDSVVEPIDKARSAAFNHGSKDLQTYIKEKNKLEFNVVIPDESDFASLFSQGMHELKYGQVTLGIQIFTKVIQGVCLFFN